MSQELIMDAIGYLDTDILAEHLRQKERLRNKLNNKKTIDIWRWSAVAAGIVAVILGGMLLIHNQSTPSVGNESALESGFKQSFHGEESPVNYCAYRSETNKFDIKHVTFDFYYGGYYDIDYELQNTTSYPTFDIYFKDDHGNKYLVKHVEENFISEKYSCDFVYEDDRNICEIKYNHSETLTIPAELFTKESGKIWFSIEGKNILAPETNNPRSLVITGICIFYKKVESGQIVLSSQEFD